MFDTSQTSGRAPLSAWRVRFFTVEP